MPIEATPLAISAGAIAIALGAVGTIVMLVKRDIESSRRSGGNGHCRLTAGGAACNLDRQSWDALREADRDTRQALTELSKNIQELSETNRELCRTINANGKVH